MKNYLAFYGDDYYPLPGMGDFVGDFDTKEEAIEAINDAHKKNRKDDLVWEWAWGRVWSCKDRIEVYSK
jgi:hypothetical protein